jgi:hypothetical protein
MKKFVVLLLFFTFSVNVVANDVIRFTWQGDTCDKSFVIIATSGKQFTISWGNGSSDVEIGIGNKQTISHTYSNNNTYTVTITANASDCRFLHFECKGNQVSSLDVSNCTALSVLYCNNNLLNSLDVSKNTALTGLYCFDNQLSSLDLSKNTALTTLRCYMNKLSSLDMSKNLLLNALWCSDNELNTLNVSKNTVLKELWCNKNKLTSLDVSKNTVLISLWCSNNRLNSLDVSKNLNLNTLWCSSDKLNNINIGDNQVLKYFDCYDNHLLLSDLFAASEIIFIRENKCLGTQILPPQIVNIGDTLFSEQNIFNDIYTNYVVSKDGVLDTVNDYTITDGMLIFNNSGYYTVTLTNAAIVSDIDFPAQVIAEIEVSSVDIKELRVTSYELRVFPNPTSGRLRVVSYELQENMSIEIYDVVGKKLSTFNFQLSTNEIDISHLANGMYFLKIDGKTVKIIKN